MFGIQEIFSKIVPSRRHKQPIASEYRQAEQTDGTTTTILMVDDDATVRKTLSAQLSAKGYPVLTAKDGQESIARLGEYNVGLMLLDLRMEGMSGIDVLEKVRKNHNALELPIIMLTSCGETEDMVKALEAGANDYVVKSGDISVLLARIYTQFSLKMMNRTLAAENEDLQRGVLDNKSAVEISKAELIREIESRMETENALKECETRFNILYDNTPTMCYVVNVDGEILSVNRYGADFLGYRRSKLIDLSLFSTYHVEDGEKLRQCLYETIDQPDQLHSWELRRLYEDGHVIYVREIAKCIKHTQNKPAILIVSVEIRASN